MNDLDPVIEAIDIIGITVALVVIIAISQLAVRPFIKKRFKQQVSALILTAAIFAGWYFIPTIFHGGVYQMAYTPSMREDCYQGTIDIGRFYMLDDHAYDYGTDYLRRLLWVDAVEHNPDLDPEYQKLPVKIRWGKIYHRFFSKWNHFQLIHNPIQSFFELFSLIGISVIISVNIINKANLRLPPILGPQA